MICLIGSDTTESYGLFRDLSGSDQYSIVYARPPFLYGTILWRALRRIYPKATSNAHKRMIWEKSVLKSLSQIDTIVVVDTALRWLELDFLNKCRANRPDLKIDCLLLNSVQSMCFNEPKIRSRFYDYAWDKVYTFDPFDAKKFGWTYSGLYYYSKQAVPAPKSVSDDLFFVGSIMGERGGRLLHLLETLSANGVNCHFMCPSLGLRHFFSKRQKGLHVLWNRVSYRRTLEEMMKSNCILEVLQKGQKGSSLRYFEAVCYNKKLLTTNAEIVNYPFYDEQYMKVFSSESDIDFEWIKRREHINYGYKDEFSPTRLFESIQNAPALK